MCLPLYIYVPHMQMPKEASMRSREAAVVVSLLKWVLGIKCRSSEKLLMPSRVFPLFKHKHAAPY